MRTKAIARGKLLPILACFFFSGAAGLIYQVAWGKALGLIFGHSVYAVATVLAVFMAGLAAGSAYIDRSLCIRGSSFWSLRQEPSRSQASQASARSTWQHIRASMDYSRF
jgi:hypothetical protein